jgi:hypothetical protein
VAANSSGSIFTVWWGRLGTAGRRSVVAIRRRARNDSPGGTSGSGGVLPGSPSDLAAPAGPVTRVARRHELRAAMSLARLWRDQGRRDDARDLLAPVYGLVHRGLRHAGPSGRQGAARRVAVRRDSTSANGTSRTWRSQRCWSAVGGEAAMPNADFLVTAQGQVGSPVPCKQRLGCTPAPVRCLWRPSRRL